MVTRRQCREWALQALVQFDLNPPTSLDTALEAFWEQQTLLETEAVATHEPDVRVIFTAADPGALEQLARARAFVEERVRGVWTQRNDLDGRIEPLLRNWSLYRLGTVERSVLRLGVWEILNCGDIPAPIIVNEAVDLAKFFSETKSGRFVNGILDHFAKSGVTRGAVEAES